MSENIYQSPNADLDNGAAGDGSISMKELLFSFQGRIGRKLYWLSMLGMFFGMIILFVILGIVGISETGLGIVTFVIYVPVLWISLAVQAKRWHDRDKSAWWILISFIPIIGAIWALVENGILAGDEGANRFGVPRL